MKEIWKAFSAKCKEAWNKTTDALAKLFADFVEEAKALLVQVIDLVKDLIGNLLKALEVIVMSLFVGVLSALFEAIYDSIMYCFDWLKNLFTKALKLDK